MNQSRITGAILLCMEDYTSILSQRLTKLLQHPIQLCSMVEDYHSVSCNFCRQIAYSLPRRMRIIPIFAVACVALPRT